MRSSTNGLLISVLVLFFLLLTGLTGTLSAQSIDGIYSNGEVSLHLEEFEDGVQGLFADSDGSYYEIQFNSDEEGLKGMLGEYLAFIPWEGDAMKLYIIPLDEYGSPMVDQSLEIELAFVSDLFDDSGMLDPAQLNWTPIKKFGTDFYPSYVLATSTWSQEINFAIDEANYQYYGDHNGYFGFNLENFPIGSIVRVEVEGEPLAHVSRYTTTITHEGISEIFPTIEYDYEALKNVTQARPVNFKYRVYANDELVGEHLETVWVRSVNDAVTYAIDHHGKEHNFNFIFAAYVNENEPSLDPILGQALDYGIVNSWIGYQGSEEDVLNQVFTLWYHFQKQGFRYSSITTQSGSDERSFGQVTRFVKDALNTTQANCIDGTVLFASFLYKIGIQTSIVLVPGHAYLAFSLDKDGATKLALETTMMGNLNIEHSNVQQDLYNSKNGLETSVQKSWSSFLGALDQGTANYHKDALPGIQSGNPGYMEIDMAHARKSRIRPIK